MLSRIIPTFLTGWFFVSLACQFLPMPLQRLFRAFDLFSLIPRWMFFSPSFTASDYHLLYRDELVDGTLTHWREVPLAEPRTFVGGVWNPERRHRKAIAGAVTALMREAQGRGQVPPGSVPYQALVHLVTARARTPLTRSTQFAIAESFGLIEQAPSRLVLVSELHPV